jgi:hypothetical protein
MCFLSRETPIFQNASVREDGGGSVVVLTMSISPSSFAMHNAREKSPSMTQQKCLGWICNHIPGPTKKSFPIPGGVVHGIFLLLFAVSLSLCLRFQVRTKRLAQNRMRNSAQKNHAPCETIFWTTLHQQKN